MCKAFLQGSGKTVVNTQPLSYFYVVHIWRVLPVNMNILAEGIKGWSTAWRERGMSY